MWENVSSIGTFENAPKTRIFAEFLPRDNPTDRLSNKQRTIYAFPGHELWLHGGQKHDAVNFAFNQAYYAWRGRGYCMSRGGGGKCILPIFFCKHALFRYAMKIFFFKYSLDAKPIVHR